jgi:hypothetical protein
MKTEILNALATFAAKRPQLEAGNYISDWRDAEGRAAYRAEVRNITRDLHHARAIIRKVELSGITAAEIITASREAFSGRLTITATDDGIVKIDYCTGQYFPTEYRKAVCAVLARALWNYWRSDCATGDGMGDRIRNTARHVFPRAIARAYFN